VTAGPSHASRTGFDGGSDPQVLAWEGDAPENHRGYLGSGLVDFARLFPPLSRIGYTGALTFESFSSAVVEDGLSDTLSIWRELWSDSDDLARHARCFIAEQLQAASAAGV
jgi:D-psicose/D-tagatose/L-ribulose 3-epimerase